MSSCSCSHSANNHVRQGGHLVSVCEGRLIALYAVPIITTIGNT